MSIHKRSAITILRWGLAFVFFYAAIFSLIHPEDWIGYFPQFMLSNVSPKLLLSIFSLYEFILAAWLFWGRKLYTATMLSIFTLIGIVVFNLNILDVVFRDIGLLFSALALLNLLREEKETNNG